jgi:5-bromo-4-chloroindolyl phosphate hydrolysis protein
VFETISAVTPRPTERDLDELREKRLAANEVFFRELNEKLERQTDDSDTLIVVCECADEDCAQRLKLSRREYEAARSEPVLFVVAHGHVEPEIEQVISRTERYELVRKIGVGREIATRLESTSDSGAPPVADDP